MKKLSFLGTLMMVGMLATSCSDNDAEEKGGLKLDGSNDAFIALSLNTPTVNVTRAGDTYTADDGLPQEYDVENGIIVFFENDTDVDTTATFVSAYSLTTLEQVGKPSTGEVTTKWSATLDITEAGFAKDYKYALVILNNQDNYISVDGKALKINGTAFTGKYRDLLQKQIPVAKFGNGTVVNTNCQTTVGSEGLLMTNAPLSKTAGNTTPVGTQYLTPIKDDNIKPTVAEAQGAPINIYVERAVAKIQVTKGVTEMTYGTLKDGTTAIPVKEISWLPDNTPTTFNFAREVNQSDFNIVKTGGSTYRYVGGQVYGSTATDPLYRTTWAIDQTYTAKLPMTGEGALVNVGNTMPATMLAAGDIAYVPENTMDYNMMYQQNTTRVVVKAIMGDGATDYYTANVLGSNKIYEKTDFEAALKEYAEGLPEAKSGTFTYTLTENKDKGTATFTVSGSGDLSTWNEKLAKLDLKYFQKGACYYKLQVRHYHPGTDATDEVKEPDLNNGPAYNSVYTAAQQKNDYLGLYGVVRNTWYVINVNSIKNVGEPTVPKVPEDTPDDEVNSYISASINVMQWAKRTQDREL